MPLSLHHEYLDGHRDELKQLLQQSYPNSVDKQKELEGIYWMRMCINHDTNKRRIISTKEWNDIKKKLQLKIQKTKSTLNHFWSQPQRPQPPPAKPTRKRKRSEINISSICIYYIL